MRATWVVSAAQIRTMSLEQLAMHVLQDVDGAARSDSTRPHAHNWLLNARQRFGNERDVCIRLSEAWSLLERRGFLIRDPYNTSGDWLVVSDTGRRALAQGFEAVKAAERLDMELHRLLRPARDVYLGGRHELAAFDAMHALEVRVRALSGESDSLLGVKLMQQAFAAKDDALGPLADPDIDGGERVATMQLFVGAIGVFKNPASHRIVDFRDATRAAEVILFADLLMRMLDDVEQRRGRGDAP